MKISNEILHRLPKTIRNITLKKVFLKLFQDHSSKKLELNLQCKAFRYPLRHI